MRFVPIKLIESQNMLALHRARQNFIKERTAHANQIRGFLVEFGTVIPQGIRQVELCMPDILEDAENEPTVGFRQPLARLIQHLHELFRRASTMIKERA